MDNIHDNRSSAGGYYRSITAMADTNLHDGGVPLVEYLAAGVILCLVAVVLYMVFGYKPY